ncbi:hypothetical protein C1752_14866 [Acaryochloris thomasi RCC1774]|uniref:HNH nuclease domain-containing protein n=1 Tax=Acaryochloris thomasi RCC1774 TaxID=1764569 RepID=A0A2W1J6K6_9CYAN|nr:hypothetical protein C1752_14866 [Acaryochloris thomasi RCC1774]
MTNIPALLRRQVKDQANYCCEYCLLPNDASFYPHEVDHIIARKHGGKTTAENLAYACWRCNRHKGTDLGSFDPETGNFSFLFNPRTQCWNDHFSRHNAQISSKTTEGRTTISLLKLNTHERIVERQRLNL